MRLRSLLYVPAHLDNFIEKAHLRNADAIILDLEDSVPLDFKRTAYTHLAENIQRVKQNGAQVFIRVNNHPDFLEQEICLACESFADGIILSKTQNYQQIDVLHNLLMLIESELKRKTLHFYALIEDPIGVINALEIAQHSRVIGLGLGSEDFSNAMNSKPDPDVLFYPKMQLHLAAKAAGKLSFGLLKSIADYRDTTIYQLAVQEAKRFGFDGSTCVHPSCVEILNEGFSYSIEEINQAKKILDEANKPENNNRGAFVLDGKMIDQPHIAQAKKILISI